MVVRTVKNEANPFYDINRNVIYKYTSGFELDRICVLSDGKENAMRALAYIILLLFCITALILIIFTIFCFNRIYDLGGLWKFFLHHWMKL